MQFRNLKEKCEYYKSLTDYKLVPNSHILLMLDGRAFSKYTKRFMKPFDDTFIGLMNSVALELCSNIEGAKFAYVQSDEISIYITDIEKTEDSIPSSWFQYRLSKLLPIAASIASSTFMKEYIHKLLGDSKTLDEFKEIFDNFKTVEFDAKAWNVPNINDVYAWFLYRQIDCIRNSKQMVAQTYFSHKQLEGKDTDEQIKMVKELTKIDWYELPEKYKFGRFLYKEEKTLHSEQYGEYTRNYWAVNNGFELYQDSSREKFIEIIQ